MLACLILHLLVDDCWTGGLIREIVAEISIDQGQSIPMMILLFQSINDMPHFPDKRCFASTLIDFIN